jgi:hypothetical protein
VSEIMEFVREPERRIPVYKRVGVVVCGGGSAGMAASVCAARNGADVLLIDRNSYIGGQAATAFQVYYGGPTDLLTGFSKEFALRLDALGGAKLLERYKTQTPATGVQPLIYHISIDPEIWKVVASDIIQEAGVKVLTNTMAVDAIMENKVIKGVIIENKSGRQAIMADVVIDATFDADISARAGVPMDKLPASGIFQPMVMLCRIGGINYPKIADYAREHPEEFNATNGVPPGNFDGTNLASIQGIGGWRSFLREAKKRGDIPSNFMGSFSLVGVNPSSIQRGIGFIHGINVNNFFPWDAADVYQAELEGRKLVQIFAKFLKTVPGFESSFLIDAAPSIGLRDSRRIIGEYVFTRKDLREGRTFDDDICLITLRWPDLPVNEDGGFVFHPGDGTEGSEVHKRQMQDIPYFQTIFGVPYRCLVPQNIERLLVAGPAISMTYMAHEPGPSRGMVPCMHWGQAAGTAAAIAIKQRILPRHIDIPTLQKTLEAQGALLRKEKVDLSEVNKDLEARGIKISHPGHSLG